MAKQLKIRHVVVDKIFIEDLTEVRLEISRVNQAAGQTIFNPAATEALQRAIDYIKRQHPTDANASCELVHRMAMVETPYEADYRQWHRAARQLHGL